MKKGIVVPALCFAVLSTPALTKAVHAATPTTSRLTTNTVSPTVTKYVNVNAGSSLLLRSKASTSGDILAKLSKGTAVTVYSTSDGWANVKADGKIGYVSTDYLSSTKLSITVAGTTTNYVNVDPDSSLILRKSPSTSSAILSSLKRGASVKVISTSGVWAKVTANGLTGYVHSEYLSSTKLDSTVVTASSTTTAKTTTKYVNVDADSSLILRQNASTSSAILSSLKRGASVKVISTSGVWAKVTANGLTGYVHAEYLSASKIGTSETTTTTAKTTTNYVNVDADSSLILRQNASTSSAILSSLKRGASVKVISTSGVWAKVTANGLTGYVHAEYLSASKIGTSEATGNTTTAKTTTNYVNVDADSSLILRQNASTSSAILSSLKRGTSVQVISTSGVWAKVTANGLTGYVHAEYLSASKIGTSEATGNTTTAKTTTNYVNVDADSSLILRQNASTSSAILSSLKRGTSVQVISTSGVWAKVTANGLTGYVHAEYLTSTQPTSTGSDSANSSQSSGSSQSSTSNPSTIQMYVKVSAGSNLNMRTAPTTSASIITKLSDGTKIEVLSEANGWAKISANGQTGYVSTSYLAPANGTPTSSTTETADNGSEDNTSPTSESQTVHMYVNVSPGSNLNMRSGPSTTASVLTQLPYGTVVQVLLETNGWAKVSANGKTGYVDETYLTSTLTNSNVDSIVETYTPYSISLTDMKNLELNSNPQTDKTYNTYIRSDALVVDNKTNPTQGVVFGSNWNVRGGAGTDFWVVGQVSAGALVQILSSVKGSDGYTWYQISFDKTWVNASPDDVTYYLDPTNFENDNVQKYQFLKLNETANVNADEVNQKILAGKGILAGEAQSFIKAGQTYGINELYLISHALLETANGTSELANGVTYNGKTVYNMYGIGAYDASPVQSGAEFAYNAGWFTPEEAIIGGAQFIDNNYIEQGQDTLYKMRWNPGAAVSTNSATHQYASDIGWASKQVTQIYNLYQLLSTYQIKLDIPQYLQ
ncbi:SH3 domain-containing protein [Pullulanibacillus sp. KACC 23026]|uniref:SH3 domain-containing protein n=1 Tax=Pullulanibacillus sp. KACC 23026 TaxID=3028315 RepID=UPI0023B0B06B|nr:SH3 domain-containing protein [Pullulanibacillus sp. KACC 23026]WEG11895.1 SH3 domain-containing protein [Pullulanibacillus sp. KACC 23026]